MWQYDKQTGRFVPGRLPADNAPITACYERLSQEDELSGDSGSIVNQRDFLLKYCSDHHFANPRFFSDDGYSGTNFERPGFREMMDLVEQGKVKTVIVKDHSRLGRNRLVVGALMERFTEDYGVRYIAVTDGIDSEKGLDDMVAVRELFNEFYPRDTSKKIRAVFQNKGNSGQRLCTQVVYGYVGNKYNWEIDPDAAAVVQKIYNLCIAGLGPSQIAKHLTRSNIPNPTAHRISQDKQPYHIPSENPCKWSANTVAKILERKEYTGCTVNFKTHKKSYKCKKTIYNPPEQWREFPDTHAAIIDPETWTRVQALRKNKRRPTKSGKQGLFSGLIYCADCGDKLYFATCSRFESRQDHYVCSNYKSNMGTCSAHYIREQVLYDLVIEHLRETIRYVRDYEDEFVQSLIEQSQEEQKKENAKKRRELTQAQRRINELDVLFQKLYEDNVSGKLSDDRFSKLSATYEDEQKSLTARVHTLASDLEAVKEKTENVAQFVSLVKRYTEVQELTPTIVNEFIERIIVYAPDKSSGHRVQRIEIRYQFVGEIPTPRDEKKSA